jgi:hypothetical protein
MEFIVKLAIVCILVVILSLSVVGCAIRPLQVSYSNILTNAESLTKGKKTPSTVFGLQDDIVFFVYVKWDDPAQWYGNHSVVWNWYLNEKLVSTGKKSVNFNSTPHELWTRRNASALGQGRFKVETLIDEKVVASTEFDIK